MSKTFTSALCCLFWAARESYSTICLLHCKWLINFTFEIFSWEELHLYDKGTYTQINKPCMRTASITRTYKRTVHQYAGIICYVLLFDVHTVQKENSLFHPFFFRWFDAWKPSWISDKEIKKKKWGDFYVVTVDKYQLDIYLVSNLVSCS